MGEIRPGTITLRTVFYRYYELRFDEPYIWMFNLPVPDSEEERPRYFATIERINALEGQACEELRQAFFDGELVARVYRPNGTGDGIAELTNDGWRGQRPIELFLGGPVPENISSWKEAAKDALTPFVDKDMFEAWASMRCAGTRPTPDLDAETLQTTQQSKRPVSEARLARWCNEAVAAARANGGQKPSIPVAQAQAIADLGDIPRTRFRTAWAKARPAGWEKRGPQHGTQRRRHSAR